MCCGGVDEGWEVVFFVSDEDFGDHLYFFALVESAAGDDEVDEDGGEDAEEGVFEVVEDEGGGDAEDDDHEDDAEHEVVLLFDFFLGLFALGSDDVLGFPRGYDADGGGVGVFVVGVDDDVFEFAFGEEFGHGSGDHGFAGAGVADEHDVAFLFCCFFDDGDGLVLADDLVEEAVGYFDFFGGFEVDFFNPFLDWGEGVGLFGFFAGVVVCGHTFLLLS